MAEHEENVWQSMLKILPNAARFLCSEIDFETMEEVSRGIQRAPAWQELWHRVAQKGFRRF